MMKSILIYLISIFFLFGNISFDNNDIKNDNNPLQKKYHGVEGNFKIMFPGVPKKNISDVPTDLGTIKMYQYMYEASQTKVYMVAFSDYPPKYMQASKSMELLQNAKNGFISSLKIKVTEENSIKIGNHPGIMFKASANGWYAVMRDYLIDNRLFQIGIMQEGSEISEKDIEDFIYSFELVK